MKNWFKKNIGKFTKDKEQSQTGNKRLQSRWLKRLDIYIIKKFLGRWGRVVLFAAFFFPVT